MSHFLKVVLIWDIFYQKKWRNAIDFVYGAHYVMP